MERYVIKGDICYSENKDELIKIENGYIVVEDGICKGTFIQLPNEYQGYPLKDYSGKLVMPGLIDLHIHAPTIYFPWERNGFRVN